MGTIVFFITLYTVDLDSSYIPIGHLQPTAATFVLCIDRRRKNPDKAKYS